MNKINLLITEKIMGWKLEKFIEEECYLGDQWKTENGSTNVDKFNPSTNINDAWLVIEKLDKEFHTLTYINNNSKTGYEVKMYKYDSENDLEDVFDVHEKTAPMGICIAALKSIGIEIKI